MTAHFYTHIENLAENDAVFDYVKIAQDYLAGDGATFNPLDGVVDKLNTVRAEVREWKESYRLKEEALQRELDKRPEKNYTLPARLIPYLKLKKKEESPLNTTEETPEDTMEDTPADAPSDATVDESTEEDDEFYYPPGADTTRKSLGMTYE